MSLRLHGARAEEGSIALELAILAPVLIALLGLIVYVGRLSSARGVVEGASHDAARAASLSRTASAADSAAQTTAAASLSQNGLHCTSTSTQLDDGAFALPLGTAASVTVKVSCDVDLSSLGLPGFPGSKTVTSTYTSPLDPYRERSP